MIESSKQSVKESNSVVSMLGVSLKSLQIQQSVDELIPPIAPAASPSSTSPYQRIPKGARSFSLPISSPEYVQERQHSDLPSVHPFNDVKVITPALARVAGLQKTSKHRTTRKWPLKVAVQDANWPKLPEELRTPVENELTSPVAVNSVWPAINAMPPGGASIIDSNHDVATSTLDTIMNNDQFSNSSNSIQNEGMAQAASPLSLMNSSNTSLETPRLFSPDKGAWPAATPGDLNNPRRLAQITQIPRAPNRYLKKTTTDLSNKAGLNVVSAICDEVANAGSCKMSEGDKKAAKRRVRIRPFERSRPSWTSNNTVFHAEDSDAENEEIKPDVIVDSTADEQSINSQIVADTPSASSSTTETTPEQTDVTASRPRRARARTTTVKRVLFDDRVNNESWSRMRVCTVPSLISHPESRGISLSLDDIPEILCHDVLGKNAPKTFGEAMEMNEELIATPRHLADNP